MLSMLTKCWECVSKQDLSSVMAHNVASHNLGTAPLLHIHFSVTKSAFCLLPETEASVSSTLILFSAGHLNNTTAPQKGNHQEIVDL